MVGGVRQSSLFPARHGVTASPPCSTLHESGLWSLVQVLLLKTGHTGRLPLHPPLNHTLGPTLNRCSACFPLCLSSCVIVGACLFLSELKWFWFWSAEAETDRRPMGASVPQGAGRGPQRWRSCSGLFPALIPALKVAQVLQVWARRAAVGCFLCRPQDPVCGCGAQLRLPVSNCLTWANRHCEKEGSHSIAPSPFAICTFAVNKGNGGEIGRRANVSGKAARSPCMLICIKWLPSTLELFSTCSRRQMRLAVRREPRSVSVPD